MPHLCPQLSRKLSGRLAFSKVLDVTDEEDGVSFLRAL